MRKSKIEHEDMRMAVLIDDRESIYQIVFIDYISDREYKITYLNKSTGAIGTIMGNYKGGTTLQDSEFKEFMLRLAKKRQGR